MLYVICIGKDVKGTFHDQFEVIVGLEHMGKDAVMTQFEVLCGLERVRKEAFTTN
jgi:hypothetical protein